MVIVVVTQCLIGRAVSSGCGGGNVGNRDSGSKSDIVVVG